MVSIAEMISIKVYWYIGECRSLVEWYLRPGEKKVLGGKLCPLVTFTSNPHLLTYSKPEERRPPAEKMEKLPQYFLVDWHLTKRSYQRRMSRVISFRSNSKTHCSFDVFSAVHHSIELFHQQNCALKLVNEITHCSVTTDNIIWKCHTHTTPLTYASFIDIKRVQYQLINHTQACHYSRSESFGATHKRFLAWVDGTVSRYGLKNAGFESR